MPEQVGAQGGIGFILGVHAGRVGVDDQGILGPAGGEAVTHAIGHRDIIAGDDGVADHVALGPQSDLEVLPLPGDDGTHDDGVLGLGQRIAVVLLAGKQIGAVPDQAGELQVPVACLLVEQQLAALSCPATTLLQHVDITIAIGVEVVGAVTGVLDEDVLTQREHVIGLETTDLHPPVAALAEPQIGVIGTGSTVGAYGGLDLDLAVATVFQFSHSEEVQQQATVLVPAIGAGLAGLPQHVATGGIGRVQVDLRIAPQAQAPEVRVGFHHGAGHERGAQGQDGKDPGGQVCQFHYYHSLSFMFLIYKHLFICLPERRTNSGMPFPHRDAMWGKGHGSNRVGLGPEAVSQPLTGVACRGRRVGALPAAMVQMAHVVAPSTQLGSQAAPRTPLLSP